MKIAKMFILPNLSAKFRYYILFIHKRCDMFTPSHYSLTCDIFLNKYRYIFEHVYTFFIHTPEHISIFIYIYIVCILKRSLLSFFRTTYSADEYKYKHLPDRLLECM
jgi:hypothetical protein